MNLLYDLTATQPSPQSKFHGGGMYGEVVFFKLLEHLDRVQLTAMYDSSLYMNPDILAAVESRNIPLFDIQKISVEQIVESQHIDRAYSAMLNLNQRWPLESVAVYTTVHGLRTLEMPFDAMMLWYDASLKEKIRDALFMTIGRRWFMRKMRSINARLVADARISVITVSQHSLASIHAFYPETRRREIPVFASPTFAQLESYRPALQKADVSELEQFAVQEKKYFLLTSAARWSKNTLRAVLALDSLFSDGFAAEFKAVVTGVTSRSVFTKRLRNAERFVFLGYVDRPVLGLLTERAYSFVYPSLNEGFGYPPVEAMKYGVPVLASGTSSVPEVCGDAALYFDPRSVSEIKNRLVQVLDRTVHDRYSMRARVRFSVVAAKQKADLTKLIDYILRLC